MSKVWIFADYSQAEARVVAWAGRVTLLKEWFSAGKDVHSGVAQMIARYVQENRFALPDKLFATKHWSEFGKGDPERQLSKSTVHANNYGMGKLKFSQITGLPARYAEALQTIYFRLFPEIRTGYQAWIEEQLRRTRTLVLPQGWPLQFYDMFGPELSRTAYALYAQSTVGLMLTHTLNEVCEHFSREVRGLRKPSAIRAQGLDVRLQIHDAIGAAIEDDPAQISYACSIIKKAAEEPISIRGEELVIPVDFKVGPTWGEAKDWHEPSTTGSKAT